MKKAPATILVVLLLIVSLMDASAQCAMCKATAESATNHVNKGIGEGLNSGIVYLMAAPYLMLATVALVFFRKRIFAFFKT